MKNFYVVNFLPSVRSVKLSEGQQDSVFSV
jgi:hypothetical protein